ncbi:MAG: hypothetical protein J6V90_08165 [Treponema sp.]|nr:hypothetical protein [Treponema sp.]
MNCMNSVVVEGKVTRGFDEDGVFEFQATCLVKDSTGDLVSEEVTNIQCFVPNNLRSNAEKELKLWRVVRVVGRLATLNGKLGLTAEMIEFAR